MDEDADHGVDATDRYTFGDNPTAQHRLELLAQVYRPATEAFLRRWAPQEPALAVDLGCGPGHTTRLLHETTRAVRTIGLDSSPRYLRAAAAAAPAGVTFGAADVARPPLPVPAADVVFARHLLTHLAHPVTVLRTWVDAVRPGGLVLVQETALLTSSVPQLRRYYQLVAALQERHGQALDVGARLGDLAAAAAAVEGRQIEGDQAAAAVEGDQVERVEGVEREEQAAGRADGAVRLEIVHSGRRRLELPAAPMARLHVLNLHTWRDEPAARSLAESSELDALAEWLERVADGSLHVPPVHQELGELVMRRRPDDPTPPKPVQAADVTGTGGLT